jgi:hypothetical protein
MVSATDPHGRILGFLDRKQSDSFTFLTLTTLPPERPLLFSVFAIPLK